MAQEISLLFLLIVLVKLTNAAVDYCNLKTCQNNTHTMCKYKSSYPAPACRERGCLGGYMQTSDKIFIVNLHNYLRNKVCKGDEKRGKPGPQPPAVCMSALFWDLELEMFSQRWLDQCIRDVDTCRNTDRFAVSTALGVTYDTGYAPFVPVKDDVAEMIYSWYDHVRFFNNSEVPKYKGIKYTRSSPSFYTQIVWHRTRFIGCATKTHYTDNHFCRSLYCSYGEATNRANSPVYLSDYDFPVY